MAASSRTRWIAGAVSLALNGLMIAAVAQFGARPQQMWLEPPVMTVELASVRGDDRGAPDRSAQAKLAPATPAPTPAPTVPASPRVSPSPSPAAQAPSTSAPSEPAPTMANAAAQAAPAELPSPPVMRAGVRDALDIQAPNGTSNDYAARLRAWLEAHKTYPRRSRMRREEGVVHIRFAVDRRGRLLDGDIVRSSGFDALDAEAIAMLGRSEPFPTAPHGLRGERIEVSTPVEFSLAQR